jgi:hypothetical protein
MKNYIEFTKNGKTWLEHRYVWTQANGEIPKGMQIHHINGNTKDNRLENLTMVSPLQNNLKMDKAGKGYTINKQCVNRPYRAQRVMNGVRKYIGQFATPCGAIMASRMAYVNT